MTAFYDDVIFPEHISLFAFKGKTERKTEVVELNSGSEQRNILWSQSRRSYDAGLVPRPASQWAEIDDLFDIVGGRGIGFLLKDWKDFEIAASEGKFYALTSAGVVTGTIGYGAGVPTYQMYRRRTNGSRTYDRKITKPKTGTTIAYRGGSPMTAGAGAGQYALDITTGVLTIVADIAKNVDANISKSISAITKANPGQVTATAHGYANGDKIYHSGIGGMTQLNGNYYTITVVDADNYTIGVNTTGYGTYTTGGTATKYGITQTNPPQVNIASHGFSNTNVLYATGATGSTQVNNSTFTVANKTTNRFELSGIDGTAYGAYGGSGVFSKYPQPSETLTFANEFYVPVRFDTDDLSWDVSNREPGPDGELLVTASSIPLIELR